MRLFHVVGALAVTGLMASCAAGNNASPSIEDPGLVGGAAEVLAELTSEFGTGPAAVGRCMRSHGFEWVVESDEEASQTEVPIGELAFAQGALDVAAESGYGIVADLRETDRSAVPEDPNEAVFRSLGPGERQSYIETRDGANTAAGVGCADLNRERERDYAENVAMDGMAELTERALASPRVASAWSRWSECLAASGYPGLGGRGEAVVLAAQLVSARVGVSVQGDGEATEAVVPDGISFDEAALEEATAIERSIAVADAQCFLDVILPSVRTSMEEINAEFGLVPIEGIDLLFGEELDR